MSTRPLHVLIALLAVLGLTAAACGGDDSADGTTTTEATGTADDGDATNGDSTDTGDDSSGDDSSGDDTDLGSLTGAFNSEECQQLSEAFDQSSLSSALTGSDPTAQMKESAAFLTEAAEDAPDEIADDIKVLAKVYGELAEKAGAVDWKALESGDVSQAMKAAELGQVWSDNPDFTTAAQNLSQYAMEHCTVG